MRITVIRLVADHSRGPRFGSAGPFLGDFDVREDFLEELDFCGRGRFGIASQRNTLAIDHHHELRSLTPLGFSDCRAPFFAGMKVASTKVSSQSRIPAASSSERNALHMFLSTPVSCQSLRRRQQVDGLGYTSGRSCHRAPVLRTQRIPSRHSRSPRGGRPPLRLAGRGGICGLIFSHCLSVNIEFRIPIGSPPMSFLRETNSTYNTCFSHRYPWFVPKCKFCNHF